MLYLRGALARLIVAVIAVAHSPCGATAKVGLRRALAFIAVATVVATVAITMSITPHAAAADATVVEAESMTLDGAKVTSDSTASAGAAVTFFKYYSSASRTLSIPASVRLIVRAKGQPCNGAPVMDVAVDMIPVGSVTVSTTSWTDYPIAANIQSGSHTVSISYNQNISWGCRRSLSVDRLTIVPSAITTSTTPTTTSTTPTTTSTTPTTTSTTSPTTSTTSPSTSPALFTGDYSTGNLNQWQNLQVKGYNDPPSGWSGGYSASVVDDSAKGKVGRFEVRQGDIPPFGGGERAEVAGDSTVNGGNGSVRWYRFSTKFDSSFYNWSSSQWGVVNQWHADDFNSPPIELGYSGWFDPPGQWGMTVNTSGTGNRIWSGPINPGAWHDITMEVKWSLNSDGYIRLWHNGVAQVLKGGSTTWTGQTMNPGTTQIYYKEGLYRTSPTAPTGIVYHSGFRIASTQAGLD